MLHVEFAKNFEEKPHKTSHKNTWCHERWLSNRKTWYTEMQDANTCHIKKLWLHLKGDIFTAFFFVCLCSSNDVCFFTPYHCFCMRPAIMTDCRAKEKEINNISSALSVALLPYFFACFPLPQYESHLSLYADLKNEDAGRCRLCQFLLDSCHFLGNMCRICHKLCI